MIAFLFNWVMTHDISKSKKTEAIANPIFQNLCLKKQDFMGYLVIISQFQKIVQSLHV